MIVDGEQQKGIWNLLARSNEAKPIWRKRSDLDVKVIFVKE